MKFEESFHALTGNAPFPWQVALFDKFKEGAFPASCNLPTGLGKTSVLAIWLLAFKENPTHVPRRLVYVVNRRTVVDQTTNEAEKLKENCSKVGITELAISTLRGQFADNREWSADPSRPAIICGTVDMIGSRLLFSGYGIGFKAKPLHAGFLGQDVLLVHDEAHLEPAFQELLIAIEKEQRRCNEFQKFHVVELSATSRAGGEVFGLTKEELNVPKSIPKAPIEPEQETPLQVVHRRMKAKKGIKFHPFAKDQLARKIDELIETQWKDSGKAILIFVRAVADVEKIEKLLSERNKKVEHKPVQVLTGTLRGLERDRLAENDAIFARFLAKPKVTPQVGTVYFICTSAGEVGVDLSADHLISDLTPLDSMMQRFGRVNRRGLGEANIDIFYEAEPDPKKEDDAFERARWKTKAILERLPVCDWSADRREAAPIELRVLNLTKEERKAAFTPEPTILPVTDILFDAWSLTTIKEKMPGRPPVEPYLHGLPTEWQPPEAHVAWRIEVGEITGKMLEEYAPADLLEDYPLKPHELLKDNASRIFERLKRLKVDATTPVWILSEDDSVKPLTLGDLIKGDKEYLNYKTILLPPSAGGFASGMLASESTTANDVADECYDVKNLQIRKRIFNEKEAPEEMKLEREIVFREGEDKDGEPIKIWYWYVRPQSTDSPNARATKEYFLQPHLDDAKQAAEQFVDNLKMPEPLRTAVVVAAQFHDIGKRRKVWQNSLGNIGYPKFEWAKSGRKMAALELNRYRHEFGSVLDVTSHFEFQKLDEAIKELVFHLIAAHHGRARPHFPVDEAFDPEPKGRNVEVVIKEVPRRFARLQRKYGRWGLAFLESLVRAADIQASKKAEGNDK
ncbi:type I-U CRISPR-associated helicase/endonuclease Cas3 [Telmatocola sphagniphila]|uniref:Type I-U CRISPR-associated helicase/endonuclease Cas3 n=1 Tax=Telmatocola sphagniphila TaxID=1123043 RepID=A0A8E6B3R7_9BACT|nr:type I-U CRISPR-associated helicase/endonuclease Cas3 [Telmatocola sphagniphila]QVL30003.1 type I-U CRISPR-associated helicase/endonuclease Cas3 [Telmatocola sphagniphila]